MEEQLSTHGGEPSTEGEFEVRLQPLLERSFDQWVAELFAVFSATEQLLKRYYTKRGEDVALPIQVEDIAEFCGYRIVPEDLNRYRSKQISLTLGRINVEDRTISIDNGIGISYSQKRYAVAHELGHAYLQDQLKDSPQLCTEARIPGGKFEFLADIFAAFLMLPPRETFDYVKLYIQVNLKRPVDHEKMMAELSSAAKYPYTRTITAYEYLRLLASYAHYHKDDIIRLLDQMKESYPFIGDPQKLLEEPIAPKELYS